jgi:hypothetical protein
MLGSVLPDEAMEAVFHSEQPFAVRKRTLLLRRMHGFRRFDHPSCRVWVSGSIIATALAINAAAFAEFSSSSRMRPGISLHLPPVAALTKADLAHALSFAHLCMQKSSKPSSTVWLLCSSADCSKALIKKNRAQGPGRQRFWVLPRAFTRT